MSDTGELIKIFKEASPIVWDAMVRQKENAGRKSRLKY